MHEAVFIENSFADKACKCNRDKKPRNFPLFKILEHNNSQGKKDKQIGNKQHD